MGKPPPKLPMVTLSGVYGWLNVGLNAGPNGGLTEARRMDAAANGGGAKIGVLCEKAPMLPMPPPMPPMPPNAGETGGITGNDG